MFRRRNKIEVVLPIYAAPGDTLIVHSKYLLTSDQIDRIKAAAAKALPDNPVVVLAGELELVGVVSRE